MPPIISSNQGPTSQPAVHPEDQLTPIADYGRALQLYKDHQLAEAVAVMQQAVKVNPDHVEARRLPYWDEELEDVRREIVVLRNRIHQCENDAQSHFRLARLLKLIGDTEGALTEWRKVTEVDQGDWRKSAQKMLSKYS